MINEEEATNPAMKGRQSYSIHRWTTFTAVLENISVDATADEELELSGADDEPLQKPSRQSGRRTQNSGRVKWDGAHPPQTTSRQSGQHTQNVGHGTLNGAL